MSSAGGRIISLPFLLNVPLGISTLHDRGAISPPTVPCSLLSALDLQEVLVTDPVPCDVNQNLLFASVSAPSPFQPQASYLENEVSELL